MEPENISIYAIVAVIVSLIFKAAYRSRESVGKIEGEAVILAYGWVMRAVTVVAGLGLAALLILARRGGAPGGLQWFLLVMLLLSIASAAEFFGTKLRVLPEELQRRSVWRSPASLPWREIEKVVWSESAKWFYLRTTAGRTARAPSLMNGIGTLAKAVLEQVPAQAYNTHTGDRLRDLRDA